MRNTQFNINKYTEKNYWNENLKLNIIEDFTIQPILLCIFLNVYTIEGFYKKFKYLLPKITIIIGTCVLYAIQVRITQEEIRQQTGFFVSFLQLSVRQDKDKWQNSWEMCNLGYMFAHKERWGKIFGRLKVRKQFLFYNIQINRSYHILYADSLWYTSKWKRKEQKKNKTNIFPIYNKASSA